MSANSLTLPTSGRAPDDKEIDAVLADCYRYIIALGRRRKERIARQAAEAAAIADGDTKTGEVCDA